MGMMDDYTPDNGGGFAEGKRKLIILDIKTDFHIDGTERKNFTFGLYENSEKHMYKTIWANDDYTNRKLTEIVAAVGLDPKELYAACKVGRGDEWIRTKLPGRFGDFDCRKGKPRKDGKQYLEPMTPSEIDYIEWKKSQGNTPHAPEPSAGNRFSDGSSADSYQPPEYQDDSIPF